jgi:Tfp pilus assembly protein PilE
MAPNLLSKAVGSGSPFVEIASRMPGLDEGSGKYKIMRTIPRTQRGRSAGGFTLAEVVMSAGITALMVGSIASAYVSTARRAEWAASSAAASNMAMQRMEQVRIAAWDTKSSPAVDELVSNNFPVVVQTLNLPIPGTNVVLATNTTTITLISSNPPIKMIRTDCTWQFMGRTVYTNSIVAYRSPSP